MIQGIVSSDLLPRIRLTLVGMHGHEEEIELGIDTGFNGDLSVGIDRVQSLGWIFREHDNMTLGDGSQVLAPFYRGIVTWRGNPRLVSAVALESEPKIGAGLLLGNELNIQFKPGGSVSISPLE